MSTDQEYIDAGYSRGRVIYVRGKAVQTWERAHTRESWDRVMQSFHEENARREAAPIKRDINSIITTPIGSRFD